MLENNLRTNPPLYKARLLLNYLYYMTISVLGVLVFFELMIRVLFYGTAPIQIFDPNLGYIYKAGTKIFNGAEGFGTVHFVADGEIETPYSGGRNVVVMGDSHTIAIQVDDSQNYVSVAEGILNKNGVDADLHNYGVMGNRMPDYIYLAGDVKQRYDPEILVIQLSVDDFFGNSFDANQPSYFVVASEGSLILKHNAPIKSHIAFIESLNRYSALTTFAYERLFRMANQVTQKKENAESKSDAVLPQPKQVDEEVIKTELQALMDAYSGIPIVIIMLPSMPRIQNTDILFQENDYKAATEVINGVNGLYLVDPLEGFNGLVSEGKFPRGFQNTLPSKAHLNVDGHQVVGKLLAQALEQIMR